MRNRDVCCLGLVRPNTAPMRISLSVAWLSSGLKYQDRELSDLLNGVSKLYGDTNCPLEIDLAYKGTELRLFDGKVDFKDQVLNNPERARKVDEYKSVYQLPVNVTVAREIQGCGPDDGNNTNSIDGCAPTVGGSFSVRRFVSANSPQERVALTIAVWAHELAHSLGLGHDDNLPKNLMKSHPSVTDTVLTPTQCTTLRGNLNRPQQHRDNNLKHVAVLTEATAGTGHNQANQGLAVISDLANQYGLWSVQTFDSRFDQFNPTGYNAFVLRTRGIPALTKVQQDGFLASIRQAGAGVLGIHSSLASPNSAWPEYEELFGGSFTAEGFATRGIVAVKNQRNDPRVRDLAINFIIGDLVPYPQNAAWRNLLRVLARVSQPPTRVEIPVIWTRKFGNGRVFYSGVGHNDSTIDTQGTFEAMKWILKISNAENEDRPNAP